MHIMLKLKSHLMHAGLDKRVLVWDISTAALVCELRGHTGPVYQLVFSRDGSLLASGGMDGCLRLWDVACFEEFGRSLQSSHKWLVSSVVTVGVC